MSNYRFAGAPRLTGALLALVMIAAGCGCLGRTATGPPVDENLQQMNRAARLAFEKRQTDQAADLYRKALERAYVRSDATAILDAQYNLAVCLMQLGKYGQALDLIGQAHHELSYAGLDTPLDLHLLHATVLYRIGASSESWKVSEIIIASRKSAHPIILNKAYYLQGLIAADAKDAARLRETLVKINDDGDDALRADKAELAGRLAMIETRWDRAIAALDEAADLRRRILEYRRMVIALALSAKACENAGRPGAAAWRYLQAGRSAALANNASSAEQMLSSAVRLSEQSNEPAIARQADYYLGQLIEKQESKNTAHSEQ